MSLSILHVKYVSFGARQFKLKAGVNQMANRLHFLARQFRAEGRKVC